jgi:hypothetical protein
MYFLDDLTEFTEVESVRFGASGVWWMTSTDSCRRGACARGKTKDLPLGQYFIESVRPDGRFNRIVPSEVTFATIPAGSCYLAK